MRASTQNWKVEMEHQRITGSVNMLEFVRGHQGIISVIGPRCNRAKGSASQAEMVRRVIMIVSSESCSRLLREARRHETAYAVIFGEPSAEP